MHLTNQLALVQRGSVLLHHYDYYLSILLQVDPLGARTDNTSKFASLDSRS